jgi:hypothetical protein
MLRVAALKFETGVGPNPYVNFCLFKKKLALYEVG